MRTSKKILIDLKNENMFTKSQTLEEYIKGLNKRFSKVFNEILNLEDYDYIVKRLKETNIID